jgi:hypothetical protein
MRVVELSKQSQTVDHFPARTMAAAFQVQAICYGDKRAGSQELIAISDTKKAAEVVYVEKIVKEYERSLGTTTYRG